MFLLSGIGTPSPYPTRGVGGRGILCKARDHVDVGGCEFMTPLPSLLDLVTPPPPPPFANVAFTSKCIISGAG